MTYSAKIEELIAERDALQAENAGLRSECADLTQRWAEWKDSLDSVMKQRNALESKLDTAIQSSAHWQHQFTELQAENERLKADREKDAFRLVWSMNWMRMSLHDHGFTKHVLERGGTADYSDCATYIDKCTTATQEAAHGIGGTP